MNNGVISRGNFDNGGTIEFSCNRGYKLIGSRVLRCVNGQWNDRIPECRKGNEKMKCVELANRFLSLQNSFFITWHVTIALLAP